MLRLYPPSDVLKCFFYFSREERSEVQQGWKVRCCVGGPVGTAVGHLGQIQRRKWSLVSGRCICWPVMRKQRESVIYSLFIIISSAHTVTCTHTFMTFAHHISEPSSLSSSSSPSSHDCFALVISSKTSCWAVWLSRLVFWSFSGSRFEGGTVWQGEILTLLSSATSSNSAGGTPSDPTQARRCYLSSVSLVWAGVSSGMGRPRTPP